MSCGMCSEKTKAGAAAAIGAPVATGAVAQPRHCPQCGQFMGQGHVCPPSGSHLRTTMKVWNIARTRKLIVDPHEITVTHPVEGYDAYWFRENRIVLSPEQKAEFAQLKAMQSTMFVTRSTQAALKLAQAVAALNPKAIPGPEPLWPGDKDAGIHIDLPDGYFIRTFKHTLGRTFAEVSQIGADQLPQRPHATKGLSVYVGKGGNGHQRAVKALIHESEELSKFLVERANMERQGSRQCERCARYVDAGGAGHTTGCDDNRATAVTLDAREAAAEGRPITDPEILKSADRGGWTVAHIAAEHGQQFTDPEILRLADGGGRSVAHVAAVAGQQFTDPEILKLADKRGITVAHAAAKGGQPITDPEILKLADRDGQTVKQCIATAQFFDEQALRLACQFDRLNGELL